MIFQITRRAALALVAMMIGGCSANRVGPAASMNSNPGPTSSGIVLTAKDFEHGGNSLLQLLATRVLSMRVTHGAGDCPDIQLRGSKNLTGTRVPGIYVDEVPVRSTCVLDVLSPHEVERVEVYPSGYSGQIQYTPNPYGLIVVHTRRHHARTS